MFASLLLWTVCTFWGSWQSVSLVDAVYASAIPAHTNTSGLNTIFFFGDGAIRAARVSSRVPEFNEIWQEFLQNWKTPVSRDIAGKPDLWQCWCHNTTTVCWWIDLELSGRLFIGKSDASAFKKSDPWKCLATVGVRMWLFSWSGMDVISSQELCCQQHRNCVASNPSCF